MVRKRYPLNAGRLALSLDFFTHSIVCALFFKADDGKAKIPTGQSGEIRQYLRLSEGIGQSVISQVRNMSLCGQWLA